MKTCILHIGHPKTGTSYIQATLHVAEMHGLGGEVSYPLDFSKYNLQDYRRLRPGTAYPGNAMPLAVVARRGQLDTLNLITREIFSRSSQITILSCEDLFYDPQTSKIIQESLANAGYAVKVVCLLPNIFLGACNGYMQRIKNHKYKKSFWFYLFRDMAHKNGFNYKKVLSQHLCQTLDCTLKAGPYMHNLYDASSDLLHQFFALFEAPLPKAMLSDEYKNALLSLPAAVNQGICAEQLALIRFARNIIPNDVEDSVASKILKFNCTGQKTHAINYLLSPDNTKIIEDYMNQEKIIITEDLFHDCTGKMFQDFLGLHKQEFFAEKPLDSSLLSSILDSFT